MYDAKAKAKARLIRERKRIARVVWWSTFGARLFGYGLLAHAINQSRGHITEVALWGGLGHTEAPYLWLFIDAFALYGKVLSLPVFSPKTRRKGYIIYGIGGGLSLAFNVTAGVLDANVGRAIYGAGVIGFIVALEWAAADIRGRQVRIPAEESDTAGATTPAAPAAAQAGSRRSCAPGCTCGRHRKAGRVPQPPAAAPTSPAGPTTADVPSVEELERAVA